MTVRGGLGKGLGALIPTGARSLEEIAPSAIIPNQRQPRRRFDEEAMISLSDSIRRLGLLQPVVVRRTDGPQYELVMGERRWRAAQKAGMSTIPALIIDTDDHGSLERGLVENVHRQDLNAIEEAAAYKQLLDEAGLTHEQLAERVGFSRPAVTNALRLLELPEMVQKMVIDGRLSAAHARTLLGLGPHPLLQKIAQKVAGAGLSVRETEELVRRENQRSEGGDAGIPSRGRRSEPIMAEVAERLEEHLQTRVKVSGGAKKGRIVIDYGSPEDLVRLVRSITGATSHSQSEAK